MHVLHISEQDKKTKNLRLRVGGTFLALTRENGKGCRDPLAVLPYMLVGCVMARIQIEPYLTAHASLVGNT